MTNTLLSPSRPRRWDEDEPETAAVSRWIFRLKDLTSGDKWFLAAVEAHFPPTVNAEGRFTFSATYRELARLCDLTEITIFKIVRRLQERGLLKIRSGRSYPMAAGGFGRDANTYEVIPPR